ncbi:hypothetical protein AVEN_271876-1 [Araneus ventricosus]|uniref:Uncharacterized protein n=1 Tax=Araneus ventricosus TaxID=182803 RepID=A0A4Y2DMR9_ARAVE|nr:hypothetical protein AVEN_271876-1 [Araneus ventricosus]
MVKKPNTEFERLFFNRLKPKLDIDLQLRLEGHSPNFIYLSHCVKELSSSQACDYTDRQTVNLDGFGPKFDIDPHFQMIKLCTKFYISSYFKFLSYRVHMNTDRQTSRGRILSKI